MMLTFTRPSRFSFNLLTVQGGAAPWRYMR